MVALNRHEAKFSLVEWHLFEQPFPDRSLVQHIKLDMLDVLTAVERWTGIVTEVIEVSGTQAQHTQRMTQTPDGMEPLPRSGHSVAT